MATAIQFLRTSELGLRPMPLSLTDGMPMLNYNSTDPGLYFRTSTDTLAKIGPCHVGGNPPNQTPLGYGEYSTGEMWLDTSVSSSPVFKIWNGTAWASDLNADEFSLTAGNYLLGGSFNGSTPVTFSVDAVDSNTPNKIVVRNGNGNFSANTITANLVGGVTGDVIGNLTGQVTGDVIGGVTGDVVGDVTGTLTGHVVGNVVGNVTGNLTGDVTGNVTGIADIATAISCSNETASVNCNVVFATIATGNLPPKTSASLTYNSVTGALSATQVNVTSLIALTDLSSDPTGAVGNLCSVNGELKYHDGTSWKTVTVS